MPIEFLCTGCQKRLRVPDTSAGKKARCPDCGSIQDVPSNPPSESWSESPSAPPPTPFGDAPGTPFAPAKSSENPYQSPAYNSPQSVPWDADLARVAAEAKVQAPATALIVFSILSLIVSSIQGAVTVLQGVNGGMADAGEVVGGVIGLAVAVPINILILVGANRMKRLESYGLAMAAAILSLLCNCGCLSFPFAIWAIVVLNDPLVKSSFRS